MGSSPFSRSVVKVLNVLFLLASLSIMGFGAYLFTTDAMDWIGNGMAIGLIIFGGFIGILSLLGLLGAKESRNKCFMTIYTVFLSVLILAQVAAVIVVAVSEGDAEKFLHDRWNDMQFEQQVDIMEEFHCGPYSDTFGEHLIQEDLVDDETLRKDLAIDDPSQVASYRVWLGMQYVSGVQVVMDDYFNDTDVTNICKIDDVIEENGVEKFFEAIGASADESEQETAKAVLSNDVCFQDCYENFKDEFMSLGNTFVGVFIAFACVEIFLLVASFCVLCDDDNFSNGDSGVKTEKYCGVLSWVIGCCVFPCICCCPVDTRIVNIEV